MQVLDGARRERLAMAARLGRHHPEEAADVRGRESVEPLGTKPRLDVQPNEGLVARQRRRTHLGRSDLGTPVVEVVAELDDIALHRVAGAGLAHHNVELVVRLVPGLAVDRYGNALTSGREGVGATVIAAVLALGDGARPIGATTCHQAASSSSRSMKSDRALVGTRRERPMVIEANRCERIRS